MYPPDCILAPQSCQALPPVGQLWPSGDDDDGDHGDGDGGDDEGDGDDDGGGDREKFARSQDATLSRFEDLKF